MNKNQNKTFLRVINKNEKENSKENVNNLERRKCR